jgi:hypothetical protein
MDEIEEMVKKQNESNMKRNPMENSMSTIKSHKLKDSFEKSLKKASVVVSSRDPFDKLEDIGKNITPEEIQMMERTAKSNKQSKRKPWAEKKHPPFRTDYNQQEEDLDYDEEAKERSFQKEVDYEEQNEEVKNRYDYNFEDDEYSQKNYDTPQPRPEPRGLNMDEEDFNIAATSVHDTDAFSQKHQKIPAKTAENFHKAMMSSKNEDGHSMFTENNLNQEIWNQNFEALKTGYLKVMQNKTSYGTKNYHFGDSIEGKFFNSGKKPPIKDTKQHRIHHAVPDNEYEKFRKTFKDNEEANEEDDEMQFQEKFQESLRKSGINKEATVSIFINLCF